MKDDSSSETAMQLVFGIRTVLQSLDAGARTIEKIQIAAAREKGRHRELIAAARRSAVRIEFVDRKQIEDRLPAGANHQGVLAITTAYRYMDAGELVKKLAAGSPAPALILDSVEDPRNLGAIIRTAECAGVPGIFIPKRRSASLNDVVAKTSAGAVELMKIARVTNISRLIGDLKKANIWVVAASAEARMDYTEWDWTQPSALVLGNEGTGIRRMTARHSDVLVKIPMFGRIDSLNVSVAAGVILFEACRQMRSDDKLIQSRRV